MKTKPKPFLPSIASFFRNIQQRTSVALMATFISISALGVSLYQAKLARQQQLASVWPSSAYAPARRYEYALSYYLQTLINRLAPVCPSITKYREYSPGGQSSV
jgi:hypothetical protein